MTYRTLHKSQLDFRGRRQKGGSLIEFALVLPLLFLLILNVINLAGMLFAWIAVSNAARAGADYLAMGGAYAGGPQLAGSSTVSALVNADLHALPHSSTAITVNVCTIPTSSCSPAAPTDPESSRLYTDGYVDVTYTYTPFIASGFKVLTVPITIPPTSIHRKAIARILN